jgi:hypothetical protein
VASTEQSFIDPDTGKRLPSDPIERLRVVEGLLRPRFGLGPDTVPTLSMGDVHPSLPGAPTIYLDTNHWIALSKARTGHPDGAGAVEVYERLLELTEQGRAVVVLSAASYSEPALVIKSARQRNELANVMSEITRFRSIRPRQQILEAQVEQALHRRLGRPTWPANPPIFGVGVKWAFYGEHATMRWEGTPEEIAAAEAQLGVEAAAQMLRTMNELLEYLALRGVPPAGVMTIPGYDLDPVRDAEAGLVERQSDLERCLTDDPALKKRLDDIITARELYWELGMELPRLLDKANMSVDSFFYKGKDWLTDFVDDLPTLVVQAAVRRQSLKDAGRPWEPNDVRDLEHLSVAVPYCRIVVTDKKAANALRRGGLDKRYGTTILDDLADLGEAIDASAGSGSGSTG